MSLFDKRIGPVFLKENSDAADFIEKMTRLSKQSEGSVKKEIERQLKLASYGKMGEENISFELKNSGIDMYVLHDIYLEIGEQSAQIDYMVFTRKRIYVLECKNLIGDIEIDSKGNFIRKYELFGRYVKEGIYSPVTQNERHLEVIKQVRLAEKNNFLTRKMFEANFENTYKSLIVLANPKTVLNDRYAKKEIRQQVYRADQLVRVIKEMDREVKEFSYSDKDLLAIAQFFLNTSKPNKSEYTARYQEMVEKCKEKEPRENTEKQCPRCGSKLVLRTAKKGENAGQQFWGCSGFPKCRYIEKYERS